MKFIFASLCTTMVFGTCVFAGDSDTEALRAEVRAMRQAYEGRIAALEDEVNQLKTKGVPQQQSAEKSVDQALAQRGPAKAAVTGGPVQAGTRINIGGYTEFSYTNRNTRRPEFDQVRTVGEIGAQLHERIRLYLEIEQEHGAVIAGPEETQGEFEIEQGYLDYAIDKTVNFRAGIMLVPVGHYNLYHEGFLNNFVDRPLVDRRVIPTTWFEEGLGFYGTPIDNNQFGLSYEAYMYNPAVTGGVDPLSGFRGIRNEGKSPTSDEKAGAARLTFEPARSFKNVADYFEVGISGYASGFGGFKGTNDAGDTVSFGSGRLFVTAADVTWEKNNLGFRSEAAWAHTDSGENITGMQQSSWGYYAEAYYKFWPKFLNSSPFGKFKDPKLVGALRYDFVDLNTHTPATPSIQRVTADISYRPLRNTVFKFDYQYDWLGSGLAGQDYDESETGLKKHNHAFLFGVTTGF